MKNLVLHPGRGMRILVHYVVALQVFLPVDYRLSSCIICLSRGRLMTRNELRETFLWKHLSWEMQEEKKKLIDL